MLDDLNSNQGVINVGHKQTTLFLFSSFIDSSVKQVVIFKVGIFTIFVVFCTKAEKLFSGGHICFLPLNFK